MPRLTPTLASQVKTAGESAGDFGPMTPGPKRARLTSVVAKPSSNDNPMWVWEFEVIEEPYVGRKQWVNTVLTDKAMWKVAQVFAAFGVPTDTDTDTLIGCTVVLEVATTIATKGKYEGKTVNETDRVVADLDPKAVRARNASFEGVEAPGGEAAPAAAVSADRF